MSPFNHFYRLSNIFIGSYKNVLHKRTNPFNLTQVCNYTRKSAEQMLGIDKPKRPLTPFFKFMAQMRPALLAKNPGMTSKEAITWSSKHWQELDAETKSQMVKEYEKDMEDYKKIKKLYESSLSEDQKEEIKRVKEEIAAAREKRKLKAEFKEMGRPKKPMSSYFLFMQSRKDSFQGNNVKEYQEKVRTDWQKLSDNERQKFEKQAQDLMNKYKKEIEAWEVKMISIGRGDLVREKSSKPKKSKTVKEQ
ncbi:transcription factor A, mitochondrial [Aricia agestis]|uniref:transcription factor A, mitochondrial n=1 Tax=Aricia agestis TaxID=91739 RepID=UPI001C207187|nr:transcription factor A, mitochondrial [Aricia agestis]